MRYKIDDIKTNSFILLFYLYDSKQLELDMITSQVRGIPLSNLMKLNELMVPCLLLLLFRQLNNS